MEMIKIRPEDLDIDYEIKVKPGQSSPIPCECFECEHDRIMKEKWDKIYD